METQQIAPHVDDIARVLGKVEKNGKKVTREEIEQALVKGIKQFGRDISLPELKRTIVKRYHGDPDELSYGMTKPLSELKINENNVDVLCRIVALTPKEIEQDGQKKKIVYGILEDDKTSKPFTAWNAELLNGISKGDVVLIKNAYTKDRQGEVQINIGQKSKLIKKDKDTIPARERRNGPPRVNERDVKIEEILKIKEQTYGLGITARVLYVSKREVNVKDAKKTVYSGILADETGQVGFTSWADFSIKQGEVLKISGGYVKVWKDTPTYNFDDRCKIERLPEDTLSSVSIPIIGEDCKIKDLKEGMNAVNITGRVISVQKKEVTIDNEPVFVYSGVIADETGKVNFSSWSDFSLNEGEVIKISNASVKTWKGMPQLSFDARAVLERLPDSVLPKLDELNTNRIVTIEKILDVGGASYVTAQGVIIDVKGGSGLILRCPECNRVLQNDMCQQHGKQKGSIDLRAKTVLDDGIGAILTILNREITENLLGMTLEECQNYARERINMDAVRDKLVELLIAQPIEVAGNVTKDETGIMLIAENAKFIKPDLKSLAEEMLAKMEVN
ncbi:MAG: hypothetical protein QXT63_04980 [Thermoplasmata archaeon]